MFKKDLFTGKTELNWINDSLYLSSVYCCILANETQRSPSYIPEIVRLIYQHWRFALPTALQTVFVPVPVRVYVYVLKTGKYWPGSVTDTAEPRLSGVVDIAEFWHSSIVDCWVWLNGVNNMLGHDWVLYSIIWNREYLSEFVAVCENLLVCE